MFKPTKIYSRNGIAVASATWEREKTAFQPSDFPAFLLSLASIEGIFECPAFV